MYVTAMQGTATLDMAEDHIKRKQQWIPCSVKQNVVISRKHCHSHDPTPLSLSSNQPIKMSRSILDRKKCGQNAGQTESLCLDKAVIAQKGCWCEEGGGGCLQGKGV